MTALALLATHWRISLMAGLVALVSLLGMAAHHYRAEAQHAQTQAAAAKATVAVVIDESRKNSAAEERASTEAATQAAQEAATRDAINAAIINTPSTPTGCATAPAIGAVLDGLRKPAPGGHASAGAHRTAHVSR